MVRKLRMHVFLELRSIEKATTVQNLDWSDHSAWFSKKRSDYGSLHDWTKTIKHWTEVYCWALIHKQSCTITQESWEMWSSKNLETTICLRFGDTKSSFLDVIKHLSGLHFQVKLISFDSSNFGMPEIQRDFAEDEACSVRAYCRSNSTWFVHRNLKGAIIKMGGNKKLESAYTEDLGNVHASLGSIQQSRQPYSGRGVVWTDRKSVV